MPPNRPYFQYKLKGLRELFVNHQNDPAVLGVLAVELEHRDTLGAVRLYGQVRRRLDELKRGITAGADAPRRGQTDLPFPDQETIHGSRSARAPAGSPAEAAGNRGAQRRPGRSPDDYLTRPQRLKRIEPLGVVGRPSKYVRNPKTDIRLDIKADAPRVARYSAALGALIADMRRQKQGSRQIVLEDGERMALDRGHVGYAFAFTEDAELFEEARVELRIGARSTDGQIASISGGKIIVAVEEDLGDSIARCVLVIDNTALLEALKERLEKAGGEGRALNIKLADDVISNRGQAAPPGPPPPSDGFARLNDSQKEAVRLMLTNDVTYIWGPPGTGKTWTLGVLIQELFERGKRVLICSNTNRAVDQVLLKLCRTLKKPHPAMESGRIVRLGRIANDELRNEFSEYVTLDGIVERRSRDVKRRKAKLETALEAIARRAATAEALLSRFAELDGVRAAIAEAERETAKLKNHGQSAVRRRDAAQSRISQLESDLERWKAAGPLRRAFMRGETAISREIEQKNMEMKGADVDAVRLLGLFKSAKEKRDQLTARGNELAGALGSADRGALLKQMDGFGAERQPLLDELASINKALADIEAAVIRDAALIGATVTKAYLSGNTLPAFDVVVVDEASMVLLPALYFAAGLAREKVVISGDFRQLPPIVQTEQKAILDEIGMDVFHAAGVLDDGRDHSRSVMLEEQHRMDKSICGLISGFMYKGRLRTAADVESRRAKTRNPLSGALTIIDTSSLWPFETQTASFSRYNLVHALVVRNLLLKLREAGHVEDPRALGICTPYAAQAKLIRHLIEDEGLTDIVEAGTVHRYQGDEKTAIVIDIPESVGGGRFIGHFLQGDHPDDDGAKLLNVAVSRAKEHLVVVANLTYLDDRLPGSAFLRDMLFQMQTHGQVVDAREILTFRPADLRGLGQAVDIDLETQRTGLFGQKDFDTVFRADVARAKSSILIFSGFVTPERVGTYGDVFRRKILDRVKIRCVTRPPQYNGTISVERGLEALNALEGIGVIIDCRKEVHQKLAIVDGKIVWLGSLNPLSHTSRTDETMMRALAPAFASELARQVAIRVTRPDGDAESTVRGENPRCSTCGGRTYYFRSHDGRAFFACESDCGWLQNANSVPSGRQQAQEDDLPREGPPCPKCGRSTRRRTGRRGPFYGCSRYPLCNGTMSVRQAIELMPSDNGT